MEVLVGTQTVFTGKSVAPAKSQPRATKFTAAKTGTVEELEYRTGSGTAGTATKYEIGVFTVEGGKPGTLVAKATGKEAQVKEKWLKAKEEVVTGEVKEGTEYFLAVLANETGGTTVEFEKAAGPGQTNWKVGGTTTTHLETGLAWVEVAEELGPFDVVALGTASGAIKIEAKTAAVSTFTANVKTTGVVNFESKTAATTTFVAEVGTAPGLLDVYYGPAGEKAAEEAVKNVTATKHNCRFLDIWPAPAAGAAVVVVVHGGGWAGGSKAEKENVPRQCQEHGYCAFNIDYRYASETVGAFPKEISDVEEAITYAINHAAANNGNPANVYLIGGSAGGHLVSEAARKMNASELKVRGVIPMSGIFDLRTFIEEMESNSYFEPQPTATANLLIEHIQFALQETLNESVAFTHGQPVVAGKTKTNEASSRTKQEEVSPTKQTIPSAARWFLFAYEKDLIPGNQPTGFKTHLEAGHTVKYKELAAKEGHGFEMWGNPAVRTEVFAFIDANQVIATTAAASSFKATLTVGGVVQFSAATKTVSGFTANVTVAGGAPVHVVGVANATSTFKATLTVAAPLPATAFMAGVSNPRPGRVVGGAVVPALGLHPKHGLHPGGGVVVAD